MMVVRYYTLLYHSKPRIIPLYDNLQTRLIITRLFGKFTQLPEE